MALILFYDHLAVAIFLCYPVYPACHPAFFLESKNISDKSSEFRNGQFFNAVAVTTAALMQYLSALLRLVTLQLVMQLRKPSTQLINPTAA